MSNQSFACTEMHTFAFSEEWGRKLQAEAPRMGRPRGTLVRENVKVVADGGFNLDPTRPQTLGPGGFNSERVTVPTPPQTERISPPREPIADDEAAPRFSKTILTVALVDTLSAVLSLGDDAAALNFANAYNHGGGYKYGAEAQEEDLCRLLPQLIHSLKYVQYPIDERQGECLVTRNLVAVREVGSYNLCRSQGPVNMLTAAMPCGDAGTPGQDSWNCTVNLRIRGVLHAAKVSGFHKLVLGAWGCGAFGNPPYLVAELFRKQLSSPEFRGAFSEVVFAIIDPMGDGNFKPFFTEIAEMDEAGNPVPRCPLGSNVDGRGDCDSCNQHRVLGHAVNGPEGDIFRCHACIDRYGEGPMQDDDSYEESEHDYDDDTST